MCPGCKQRVHAPCKEGAKCFRCVCTVFDTPPGDVMRPCKSCMHRAHDACAIAVPHRIEWVCKTCIPKPQGPAPPAKKKTRRHFNPRWQVGTPWLRFGNGVMWCAACKEYPQAGMLQAWSVLRRITVLEHSNSGLHVVLWHSGKATVHPQMLLVFWPNECGMLFLVVPFGLAHCQKVRAVQ